MIFEQLTEYIIIFFLNFDYLFEKKDETHSVGFNPTVLKPILNFPLISLGLETKR
jgi:hypothetical protein